MSKNEILDNIINELTENLTEVKPLRHPLLRVLPWLVCSVIYTALVLSFLVGARYDLSDKLGELSYIGELIFCFAISLSGALGSAYLSVPDSCGKKTLSYLPIGGFIALCIYYVFGIFEDGFYLPPFEWHHCVNDGLLMVGIPVIVMIVLMRKGATTHPILMAVNNVIATGLLGWIGLRMTCGAEGIGHLFAYHFMPFMVLGIIMMIFAKWLYKW